MPASARWLAPLGALSLAAGAGIYAISRGLHSDAAPPRATFDLAGLLDRIPEDGFELPEIYWRLALPADHGEHLDARTETWSISAHLRDERGEDIGIQFALLRAGLAPPGVPQRESLWELRALYRGHVILFDEQGASAGEERFQRDLPGIAGEDAALREVRLDNWTLRYGDGDHGDRLALGATVGTAEVNLVLAPTKAALPFNTEGAAAPFQGYGITRMDAGGYIVRGTERTAVSGTAWLDHLWGDVPLPVGPIVFDRLLLQLDDGTDLSVTQTRRRDGGGTPTLAGFIVNPQGEVEQIADGSLEMEAIRAWGRDRPGGPYAIEWRLRAGELDLTITPISDDQAHVFATPVWSGLVTGRGSSGDKNVSGRGTLLLAGDENQ